jgi:hypothetical protein
MLLEIFVATGATDESFSAISVDGAIPDFLRLAHSYQNFSSCNDRMKLSTGSRFDGPKENTLKNKVNADVSCIEYKQAA